MKNDFHKVIKQIQDLHCTYEVAICNVKLLLDSLRDEVASIGEDVEQERKTEQETKIKTLRWVLKQFGEEEI